MAEKAPWKAMEFCDWHIVRMYHIDQPKERYLFVKMKNSEGETVTECGPDDETVWRRLRWAVEAVELEADDDEER